MFLIFGYQLVIWKYLNTENFLVYGMCKNFTKKSKKSEAKTMYVGLVTSQKVQAKLYYWLLDYHAVAFVR